MGSRVYVTKKELHDDVLKDEMEVEILLENDNSVSHPPSETVYVIKTSGSTGTKIFIPMH